MYLIIASVLGAIFIFAVYKSETTRLISIQSKVIDTTHSDLTEQTKTRFIGESTKKTLDKSIPTIDPPNTDYSLLKVKPNNESTFRISLRISEKLSDSDLESIAREVKEDVNTISNQGAVFFFLPEMVLDNGAWAAVYFTPEMKVRIIGQSIIDGQKIQSALEDITDYVGLWSDNFEEGDIIIRIRKDKKEGYVLEYISSSDHKPSDFTTPLIKKIDHDKTIYKDTEHPEQYFLLEANGDLSVYDNHGLVSTYKKLK